MEQKTRLTFFPYNINQLLIIKTSLWFSVRTHIHFSVKQCTVSMPWDSLPCSCHAAGPAAQHSCWGCRQGSPRRFFLIRGVPAILRVLSTFEIEDSLKKHPFFLQIANGKSNFSKLTKSALKQICSSGCSPEWTPSTKSVSQSWQSMGCPSSLQHVAVDHGKQFKVRNLKKEKKSKPNSFLKIISVCERIKQILKN